jgi:hypothetical protein
MADKPSPAKRATRPRPKAEIVSAIAPAPDEKAAAESPQGALAFIERARDVLTVRRVFGDPIERDGVTVIPAANVRGGGGGGGGEGPNGQGSGGGFGVSATPAGAYVIRKRVRALGAGAEPGADDLHGSDGRHRVPAHAALDREDDRETALATAEADVEDRSALLADRDDRQAQEQDKYDDE